MVRGFADEDVLETTAQREITVEALVQASKPCVLEMLRGPGAPRLIPLDRELVIGRARNADVPLAVADLSRRHLSLTRVETEWRCQDLDSRNGVYLNGVRIHSAVLRDGDRLQLGRVVFLFHQGR